MILQHPTGNRRLRWIHLLGRETVAEFTNRSLRKALLDTERLVSEISLRKKSIFAISIDSFGDTDIHCEPGEFVRVFKLLRVRRDTMEAHLSAKGDLHASFIARQTKFTCMIDKDTPEFLALMGRRTPAIATTGRQQLLIESSSS